MRLLAFLAALLITGLAHAAPVQQSGTVSPGHLSCWTTTGVIQDCGTPSNPFITGGFGITSGNQQSIVMNSAAITGAYEQLGLGSTPTGGYITYAPFGGASNQPLNITAPSLNLIVNGTTYPFPGPTGPYLPLSGGTLVGPLVGTSYSFSSDGSVGGNFSVTGTLSAGGKTITPNASGTFYPGHGLINIQSFCNAASGCTTNSCGSGCTYTPTAGTNQVRVRQCGGGGAGGGAPNGSAFGVGAGGGAGAYAELLITSSFSGVTVTVGAGGVGASGTTGGNGAQTTFGALLTTAAGIGGGSAGPGTTPTATGGAGGGTPTAGYIRIAGSNGVIAHGDSAAGSGIFTYGTGGNSVLGQGGVAPISLAGIAATGYCAGGGGAVATNSGAQTGGAGAQGITIVEEWN